MILEERSKRILNMMLEENGYIALDYLSSVLNVSKRTIYNDIDSINLMLGSVDLNPLEQARGLGYRVALSDRSKVQSLLKTSKGQTFYSQQNRIHLIFCIILGHEEKIDIEYLQDLLSVSRNTLFSDLKLIRSRLERYNLFLDYNQHDGYTVEGELVQKRSLFLYHFIPLVKQPELKEAIEDLFIKDMEKFQRYLTYLEKIENELNTEYIDESLYNLAILMTIESLEQPKDLDFIESIDDVTESKEYELVSRYFQEFTEYNKLYYSIHLLGSMKQIKDYHPHMYRFTEIALDMVEYFQVLAALEFKQVTLLISNIANHLAISMYRYRYGLHQSNPLLEQIQEEYREVYDITHQVCDVIRNKLKVPVSASEVAYITLHFNSFIRRNDYQDKRKKLMIVCPQGLSTSAMLRQEIQGINSDINIYRTLSIRQFYDNYETEKPDFIISTVKLEIPGDYTMVNPVLTKFDREKLQTLLGVDNIIEKNASVERILDIITPYIDQSDRNAIEFELIKYLGGINRETSGGQLSLAEVLVPSLVSINEEDLSWEQAIRVACQPLRDRNVISNDYAQSIIEAFDNFGSYMILENGYVLLHASYNDGVNNLGLSFMKLKHPINYKNKKGNKIFVIAPVDQNQHLRIMSDLLNIFSHETLHHEIDNLDDAKDIYDLLVKV